jgi:superfamily II DNA or RNA helicase
LLATPVSGTLDDSVSDSATDLALRPLPDWLPELDSDGILALTGARAWARARQATVRGKPRSVEGKLVRARMVGPEGSEHWVNLGMNEAGGLACLCDCEAFASAPPCGHVAGVLLYIAQDAELRGRLAGAPTRDAAAEREDAKRRADARELLRRRGIDLESLRHNTSASAALDLTFDGWRRRGSLRPIGDAKFSLEVLYDPEAPERPPGLRVSVYPEGSRRPFSPDELESRRLPASEWRLLEPLAHSPSGRPEFLASGDSACSFLERAAEAGIKLSGDEDGYVSRVTSATLRPALVLRPSRRGEFAAHPAISPELEARRREEQELHEAWVAYSAIVESVDELEFRDLLDIGPASIPDNAALRTLEAQWVASDPDGAPNFLPLPAPLSESIVFRGATSWVFLKRSRTFARIAHDVGPIALMRLLQQPSLMTDHSETARLPALLLEHFAGEGVVLPRRPELGLPPLPRPRIVLRAGGSTFEVEARLEAEYQHGRFELRPGTCADVWDDQRDGDAERAAVETLVATSLRPESPRRGRRRTAETEQSLTYRATGEAAVEFWTRELPKIVARASNGGTIDEVVVPAGLGNLVTREPIRSRLDTRQAGSGLLRVALAFGAEGVTADIAEIRAALQAKRRWVKLTDGSIASLSGKVAELASAAGSTLGEDSQADLKLHRLGETQLWSELADEVVTDEPVRHWAERLRALDVAVEPSPVAGLQVDLRSYQRSGLAWLQFLTELGVGGILADDMGLGKTAQALSLLAWRKERDGTAPSLVVAPTSVASNWIREAARFAPDLRCLLLHGSERHERTDEIAESDMVVTTYALLRRDIARLQSFSFRYVILDEAQHIKNHTAATTAAARKLVAEGRLALTGTPLENRLLELWSIFEFVNPGMLGSWRDFNRRWERPLVEAIAGEGEENETSASRTLPEVAHSAEAASLRARIRPFLLRRTKAEVQRDLPPKIETDIVVDLTPAQRRAYAALAAATREDLGKRFAAEGFEKNRMVILTALLRLRQLACDPRLVDSKLKAEDSAKLMALRELVSEVISGGRRALVFSQFVQLLGLVREDLDASGIEYAYLDGRTRDRQAVIDSFVQGEMPLFLLSLRAGGTGLNLAAADVVIHLDPWWNPAVEEQATDRAHRIGQEKTVSVYRIVAAGTIEEAISRLKQRKQALSDAILGAGGESSLPRGLDEGDVAELLNF